MRWPVFLIVAYLFMVLQVGLAPHLGIPSSWGRVEPQLVLLLAVFVALSAPAATTVVACAALGLLLDLAGTYSIMRVDDSSGQVLERVSMVLVGPYTLGYMAGGYLVVQFRPMLFRQHPMTIATMTVIGGAAVHLVVLGIFAVRQFYEPVEGFEAWPQLAARGLGLLYSAAIGVFLAYPLGALAPFFGFNTGKTGQRKRG